MLNDEGFAANDNTPFEGPLDEAVPDALICDREVVELTPDDARELGLNGTTISLDRFLYLLSGDVLEQDEEMAKVANRIADRFDEDAS